MRMTAVVPVLVLVIGLPPSGRALAQPPAKTYRVAGFDITVEGDLKGFAVELKPAKIAEGLEVAAIRLTSPTPQPPPRFTLKWSLPSHDVVGQWTTGRQMNKTIHPDSASGTRA